MDQFLLRLYRIQQRLEITRGESAALITLIALLLIGIGVRALHRQPPPPPTNSSVKLQSSAVVRGGQMPGANRSIDSMRGPAAQHRSKRALSIPVGTQIELNTASVSELTQLPEIGPVLADRIVRYRSRYGFRRVEDLTRVRGIGPKTIARLEPLVVVDGAGRNVSSE